MDSNTKKILENLTRMADEARRILDAFSKQDSTASSPSTTASPEYSVEESSEAAPTPEGEADSSSEAPPTDQGFIACAVRPLPKRLLVAAAKAAIDANPANAPFLQGPSAALGANRETLDPLHIALLTSKYLGKEQRVLTVSFMESTPSDLRDRIISHMNAWYDGGCGIQFKWTAGVGDVRISRGSGGYYSYLGEDIFHIPKNRQTMNLQGFTMSTPESEYKRVVRHETGHCLVGDTLIDCPRDLKKHPLGIPIKDLVGQRPWVYAWSEQEQQIIIKQASRVWLSKKQVQVIRVRLKTGAGPKQRRYLPPLELVGTPNHLVLLADGRTWKPLGKLKPGDRLCSLYRSGTSRSTIRWTGSKNVLPEHVFICEQLNGPRPDGYDCHHINVDKMDQRPENLQWKLEYEHCRDHSRVNGVSKKARERSMEAWTGRKHTEESRAKMSMSAQHRPPISEETRARKSAAGKRCHTDELRAKKRAAMERFFANGGQHPQLGKHPSPETRAKRAASMKATLARKKAAKAAQKSGVTVNNHIVASIERVAVLMDVYDMTVPGADSFIANGVVVHNSLGAPHEHMRKELVERLDINKTIQWFRQYQGWDQQTVQEQVLTPLDDRSLMSTPADQDSSMCYQLPGSITKDGKPINGGIDINQSDQAFMNKLYPRSDVSVGDEWDWLV
jgi:hypothetical protein